MDTEKEEFRFLHERPRPGETNRAWAIRMLDVDPADLRVPEKLTFYGQESAKTQIEPFIDRNETFPNTLILGMPGVGKTRLAKWIASRRYETFEELFCPINPDDIPLNGIVLLDECHRQRHPEWLFPTMEDDSFTIIGATSRPELLDPAFKSRFILQIHLRRYEHRAMKEMVQALLPGLSDDSADMYASASAGNPRQLELIVEIARAVGQEQQEEVLSAARITGDGLTADHLRLLSALRGAQRPIGLTTLAGMLYVDEQSVRDWEQYLIEIGHLEVRSNGRILSKAGKRYMKALDSLEQT